MLCVHIAPFSRTRAVLSALVGYFTLKVQRDGFIPLEVVVCLTPGIF